MIAVINIGVGNIKSVLMALKRVAPSEKVEIVSTNRKLDEAHKIIFPGQGSMTNCFFRIKKLGLLNSLKKNIQEKPFFGICLGKQFLFEYSEEGQSEGLGLISGEVKKFNKDKVNNIKIPHMGWNKINLKKKHQVFDGFSELTEDELYFYFVHSFFVVPKDKNIIVAESEHGIRFPSVIAKENVIATQFHPEKSAHLGLRVLKNFVSWNP